MAILHYAQNNLDRYFNASLFNSTYVHYMEFLIITDQKYFITQSSFHKRHVFVYQHYCCYHVLVSLVITNFNKEAAVAKVAKTLVYSQSTWIGITALPLTTSTTKCKTVTLCASVSHVYNGGSNGTFLSTLL